MKKTGNSDIFHRILFHLLFISGIIILLGFWKCPIKLAFSFPCPACGMTRALKAALKLDFKTAFYYHPLFPVALPLMFFIFHEKLFGIKKSTRNKIYIFVGILFLAVYVIRVFILGIRI